MKDKIFLYAFIIVIPFIICFSVFNINSYCALPSYTLDGTSLQLIQGGLNEASNFSMSGQNISGLDPFSIFVIGVTGDMLSKTEQRLEQKYGLDLLDLELEINDRIENGNVEDISGDAVADNLSKGFFKTQAEALANGMRTLTTKVIMGGYATKMTIMAMINGNKLENALPNAYVKVNDDMLDNLGSVAQDMIDDNELYNFSQANHYLYGKTFHFIYGNWENYTLQFAQDVVICSSGQAGNGYNRVAIIVPSSIENNIPCTGVVVSGNSHVIDYCYGTTSQGTVVLDGINYSCSDLIIHCSDGTTYNPYTAERYGEIVSLKNSLTSYDQNAYYKYSNYQNIYNLLSQLKNKWVTTDDLKQINDSINNLQLGNISIDGQNLNVIDTSADKLSDIENLIQQILDRNADVNSDSTFDSEPSPEPEPEPEPDPIQTINQGIDIPNGFNGDILTSFKNIITLPTRFFSVFEPLFKILGSNPAILGMWLFFPVFLLIMFVIWALK